MAFDPLAERAFVQVYELPEKLTDGFCFGPGKPITFLNVDWFECSVSTTPDELREFVAGKKYRQPGSDYLVLSDHAPFTFVIAKEAV